MDAIDYTQPLQFNNGAKVRLLANDLKGQYPVAVVMESPSGEDYIYRFALDGTSKTGSHRLMNVPPVKHTKWLNIYKYTSQIHDSKEDADEHACSSRISCVPITYTEGDGL